MMNLLLQCGYLVTDPVPVLFIPSSQRLSFYSSFILEEKTHWDRSLFSRGALHDNRKYGTYTHKNCTQIQKKTYRDTYIQAWMCSFKKKKKKIATALCQHFIHTLKTLNETRDDSWALVWKLFHNFPTICAAIMNAVLILEVILWSSVCLQWLTDKRLVK